MPDRFLFDRRDPSNGFTVTPDSEIVTMYDNGVSMSRIVRTVVWQDKVKKTVAERRVRDALLQHHLGRSKFEPVGNLYDIEPFPDAEFD